MFDALEKQIGIVFKNHEELQVAFTHRSYLNEHKKSDLEHNERHEFLGDAVLELVTTEYLFQRFPKEPEGVLTNWRSALVKGEMLAKIARQLHLGDYLMLSRGEENSGGREKDYLLANVFEALIGVIYLQLGYQVTKEFITKYLLIHLDSILKEGSHIDSKSRFQEAAQDKVGITPMYKVVSDEGPDHDKQFTMGAYLAERLVGKGKGSSKQAAEQKAAEDALKRLKW